MHVGCTCTEIPWSRSFGVQLLLCMVGGTLGSCYFRSAIGHHQVAAVVLGVGCGAVGWCAGAVAAGEAVHEREQQHGAGQLPQPGAAGHHGHHTQVLQAHRGPRGGGAGPPCSSFAREDPSANMLTVKRNTGQPWLWFRSWSMCICVLVRILG